jgi:hypothetical protein
MEVAQAMETSDLERVVITMAEAMRLTIDETWLAGVTSQLAASLAMARIVDEVAVSDDCEPAPVYRL